MRNMWREDVPMTKNPLKFFLFTSRPYLVPAALATVLAATADVLSASVSYVFKLIANAAAALPDGGSYESLLIACILMVAFLGGAKVLWRVAGYFASAWGVGAMATARYALTSYVTLHSRAYFSDRFAGSIANKISHASRGMLELTDKFLWSLLEIVVTAATSLILAYHASPLIALIFLAWILAVVAFNMYLVRKRIPLSVRSHDLETRLTGMTVDLLTNVSAMQEYARRGYEMERFRSAIGTRHDAGLHNWRFGEFIRVVNSILLVIFGGTMTLVVVHLTRLGIVSVGDVILVLTIIFRIEGMLQSLGSEFNHLAETWGEVHESLLEIVEPYDIPDAPGARQLAVRDGDITFRDVTFSYGDSAVFERMNITIPAGQRVGLVGRSGAGKSTLMRLLLHHHDINAGSISIDEQNIAAVTQSSLREAISIVPQEPILFHRSIRENIAYGRPEASVEEVMEAAHRAQAHDFIMRLPQGYEALVGERGVKLSGGERQRIAIARAILKRAPILLLDEATSALDSESEVAIQAALGELMHGKTVIAIAHRLSTLREMDRIIVMEQGKIVEDGTHEDLVRAGGVYAGLWRHQAGGFLQD